MKWIILLLGVSTNAAASVLIKYAMMPPRKAFSLENIWVILTNWPLLLGLTLYGLTFILYTLALSRLPLNVAHPILTAGSIATVSCLSVLLFNEDMTLSLGVGLALITIGVICIGSNI